MTDHVQTNDFAHIQDFMSGARHGALLTGPIFVAAGAIYGVASLSAWTVATSRLPLAAPVQSWIWLTANAIFCSILYMRMMGLRMPVSRRGWMAVAGVGSFAVAMMAGFLINSPAVYLLFAAGLIGLLAAPGLALIHCGDRSA